MSKPTVGILDYGSGNLHSAARAIAAAGADVTLSSDHDALNACERLVVPGVGAFAACMQQLAQAGGIKFVQQWAGSGRPMLGICVGHQVFFKNGLEKGISAEGIGLYDGSVEMLTSERLPHMGWNKVQVSDGSDLFDGIADERFYFVHSYGSHGIESADAELKISWCEHESDRFIAAVQWRNICSTQFHPEKSGEAGARLLRNWLKIPAISAS